MRRISLILALASVTLVPVSALAQDVKGFEARSKLGSKGLTIPYRLFKVQNPVAGTKYPLILFLHGAGERGTDNAAQLNANEGATAWATPAHQTKHPAYVIAPQCPNNEQWVHTDWGLGSYSTDAVALSDPLATALEIVDEVATEFDTDPSRLYVTGLSMGGYGTWDTIIRNPTKFAAAIPVCGSGDLAKVDLIKDLPIWTFHGDADNVVPPKGTRDIVAALEAVGSDIQYTEYPGRGHDAWVPTYADEAVIDWMFTNQKAPAGAGGMAGAGGSGGGNAGAGGGAGMASAGASGMSTGGSVASGGTGTAGASVGGTGMGVSGSTSSMAGTGNGVASSSDDSGCSIGVFGTTAPRQAAAMTGFLALLLLRRRARAA